MPRNRSSMSLRSLNSVEAHVDYIHRTKKPSRMIKYSTKNELSKKKLISWLKTSHEKNKYEVSRFFDDQSSVNIPY